MLIFILLSAHVQDSSKSFFHKFLYYTIFFIAFVNCIVLFLRFTIEINVFVCIHYITFFAFFVFLFRCRFSHHSRETAAVSVSFFHCEGLDGSTHLRRIRNTEGFL